MVSHLRLGSSNANAAAWIAASKRTASEPASDIFVLVNIFMYITSHIKIMDQLFLEPCLFSGLMLANSSHSHLLDVALKCFQTSTPSADSTQPLSYIETYRNW